MDCREIRDRISEFRDGTLHPAEAEGVGAHLRACRECAGVDRALAEIREGLRRLPVLPAPPELTTRVREAIAREERTAAPAPPVAAVPPRGRSDVSRRRLPFEAVAAVLLVASILWYQRGDSPPPPPPQAPARIAAPSPPSVAGPASAGQEARPARKTGEAPSGGDAKPAPSTAARSTRKEIASLPPGAPAPVPRSYSAAELPAAPAVRASSESARIVPGATVAPAGTGDTGSGSGPTPGAAGDAAPAPAMKVATAPPSRMSLPLPYGREIVLEVAPEGRESAGARIADAARRLGGAVERVERDVPGGIPVAVSVLLPEVAGIPFLSEVERIGKVPSGKAEEAETPTGPRPGTVSYTVRIRVP